MENILECKICGGKIIPNADGITGKCESCGATTVIPKETTNSSKINRANYLRRANDFDKAISLFEEIIAKNPDDSEAYWGLVLCKYGIEYVDDVDGSKKPTCHRTMKSSILDDPDYKAALDNSVGAVHYIYEEEAQKIDEIQKKIKAIAANEKPYDIFICYKESDDLGQRTHDSLDVQDIYNRLTNKGFKVFYARKTLQDKLGSEYEPIIYAALSSARIMLVYGSEPEYFNAVWVKNEWSRFCKMMAENPNKKIIPIFDGSKMNAYDLPNELADFQAFDKYKIGFIEDLVEGLEKILSEKEEKTTSQNVQANENQPQMSGILQRAFLFLEDGNWNSANEYFEKYLDSNPTDPTAYLGKLMVEFNIKKEEEFENNKKNISISDNYDKIIRFADDSLKKKIEYYKEVANYNDLKSRYSKENNRNKLKTISFAFQNLGDFKDSKELSEKCIEKGNQILYNEYCEKYNNLINDENCDSIIFQELGCEFETLGDYKDSKEKSIICKDKAYLLAIERKDKAAKLKNEELLKNASNTFKLLKGYKDSEEQAEDCLKIWDNCAKEMAMKKAKRNKIMVVAVCALIIIGMIICFIINNTYNRGVKALEKNDYEQAMNYFRKVHYWRDSVEKITECGNGKIYNEGVKALEEKDYTSALGYFRKICHWKDSKEKIIEIISEENMVNRISAGKNHIVGLKQDGTVVAVGSNNDGQCNVSEWKDVIAVSAGSYHTIGLKSDGTVVAVGDNDFEQCNVSEWKNIIAISAGDRNTVGLKSDGTVVVVGNNDFEQCNVSEWKDIIAVLAGNDNTNGLKSDGTVIATGYNYCGQCNVSKWKNIIAISAGNENTVGLKSDGTVVATGRNSDGQCNVSEWKDIIAISAGSYHTIGLKSDGTVVATGDNYYEQCNVSGWKDIIAVSAGKEHTVGLKSDGTVVVTGDYDVSNWNLN